MEAKNIAGLNGAVLVGDLSRPGTFKSLEKYWIPLCDEVTGETLPPMMFMGNKVDLIESQETLKKERNINPKNYLGGNNSDSL